MNSPWKTEYTYLIGLFISIFVLGFSLNHWVIAITLPLFGYIFYVLYRLHELHQWLKNGIQDHLMPDTYGVWGDVARLIYQHKKTVEESHLQQMQLSNQLQNIISAIPTATIIINNQHEIIWSNPSALPLLGIDSKHDAGIKIDNIIRQEKFFDYLQASQSTSIEITSPVSPEKTLAIHTVELDQERIILLAYDLTPHIDSQKSRKSFIANVSHELRTPLTVISGYLDFLQSSPDLPQPLKQPIECAIEQAENMELIIHDLLNLAKIEGTVLNTKDLTEIDLDSHLLQIINTVKSSSKAYENRINHPIKTGLTLQANKKEINSVCLNLINNALNYSDPNTPIRVEWAEKSKTHISFSVSDHGKGIAPEHIIHLTERFYRVDSGRSKRAGGTGLGLSIVKHIIERYSGELIIHSKVAEGSTFTVILPKRQTK